MKTKLLILGFITLIIAACKKDQYTSKPQISFDNINSTSIATGQLLSFSILFTDAEGDIQDTLWIQKISKTCPTSTSANFAVKYPVPNFPASKNLKGYLDINFIYNTTGTNYVTIAGCGTKNDSSYFRFVLKDKANNVSDTLVSPIITLLK
ncbi:MAG: hypothetical protein J0I09_02600 [Sphingobacteriia bacterium]|nr:hypothetical protein [Sphingobacteriia bacterium]